MTQYYNITLIMYPFQSKPVDMLSGADSRGVLIGPDPPTTAEEEQCSHLLCRLWPIRKMCRILLCRPRSRHSETSQKLQEKDDHERALLRDHESNVGQDNNQSTVSRKELHHPPENSQQRSHEGEEHGSVATTPQTKESTVTLEAEKTTGVLEMPSSPTAEGSEDGQQDENEKKWKRKSLKQKWSQQKKNVKETLWVLQFIVLLHRTFKRSRRRLLTKMVLFQVSYI